MIPLFFCKSILLCRKLVATVGGALLTRFETIHCTPVYLLCYIMYFFIIFVFIFIYVFLSYFQITCFISCCTWFLVIGALYHYRTGETTVAPITFRSFMTLVFFIPILEALIMLMIVLHLVGYVSMLVNMDYFSAFYSFQLLKEIIDIHVPLGILNLLRNH